MQGTMSLLLPAVAGCRAPYCNLCGKLCAARSVAIREVKAGADMLHECAQRKHSP